MCELPSESFWIKFLRDAGFDEKDANNFAKILVYHRIDTHIISDLDANDLREMGINRMGDIKSFMLYAEKTYPSVKSSKRRSDSVEDAWKTVFKDLDLKETIRKLELLVQMESSASNMNKLQDRLRQIDFRKTKETLDAILEAQEKLSFLQNRDQINDAPRTLHDNSFDDDITK